MNTKIVNFLNSMRGVDSIPKSPVDRSDNRGHKLNEVIFDKFNVAVVSYDMGDSLVSIIDNKVLISPMSNYSLIRPIAENIVIVKRANKMGVSDFNGEIVIPLVFDSITPATDLIPESPRLRGLSMKEMLVVKRGKRYGVLSLEGDTIIPFEYDDIKMYDPRFGVFVAKSGLSYGLVDLKNNIGDFTFNSIEMYLDAGAYIGEIYDGDRVLLSKSGDVLCPGFSNIMSSSNNMFIAGIDEHQIEEVMDYYSKNKDFKDKFRDATYSEGCLDARGNIVIPFIYDSICLTKKGVIVRLGDKKGLCDYTGKVIASVVYDQITPLSIGVKRGSDPNYAFFGVELNGESGFTDT